MSAARKYTLVFLFRAPAEQLAQRIRVHLEKELREAQLTVQEQQSDVVRITISGLKGVIDASHDKLNRQVCSDTPFARLVDELGQDIRRDAYPILADLEEKLRAFINEAMISAFGFDWWERIGMERMRERVAEVEEKNRARGVPHHPIEYSEFEHLVALVTSSLSHWKEDDLLSVGQLAEILRSSSSMADAQQTLESRMEKRSLWDSVFSRLFENEGLWTEAKENLINRVIPLRHKVMHHRPIRLYELRQLQESSAKVTAALESRRRVTTKAESAKLERSIAELAASLAAQQARWTELMRPMVEQQQRWGAIFEQMTLPMEHLRPMIESMEATQRHINALGGINEYLRRQKNLPRQSQEGSEPRAEDGSSGDDPQGTP